MRQERYTNEWSVSFYYVVQVGVEEALKHLGELSYQPLKDFAKLDAHRGIRSGFPEVVFGQGKSDDHLEQILKELYKRNRRVLATRVAPESQQHILPCAPREYNPQARTLTLGAPLEVLDKSKIITIASGGTADHSVAEEAAVTAQFYGYQVQRVYDIGVAGLPRLLGNLDMLQASSAIVCVAGMEGALPSVLAGLVSCPIIAVPTSVVSSS